MQFEERKPHLDLLFHLTRSPEDEQTVVISHFREIQSAKVAVSSIFMPCPSVTGSSTLDAVLPYTTSNKILDFFFRELIGKPEIISFLVDIVFANE
jgi:hypothetical protein